MSKVVNSNTFEWNITKNNKLQEFRDSFYAIEIVYKKCFTGGEFLI